MKSLPTPVGVWLDAGVGGMAIGKENVSEYDHFLANKIASLKKKYKATHRVGKDFKFTEDILAEIRAEVMQDPRVVAGRKDYFVERAGEPLRSPATKRLQVKNDKGGDELAFRPGWHLGEWPDAKQFNKDDPETKEKKALMPKDLVFALCEVSADVDYQLDALSYGLNANGSFNRSQAGLPRVPKDGYYKYRTNVDPTTAPWLIAGSIKVVEILDDDDCARICAKYGVTPDKRVGGKKIDLSEYGLKRGPVDPTVEGMERFAKNEASKANDALLEKALADPEFAEAYVRRDIDFDNPAQYKALQAEFAMNGQDIEAYRKLYEERGFATDVSDMQLRIRRNDPVSERYTDPHVVVRQSMENALDRSEYGVLHTTITQNMNKYMRLRDMRKRRVQVVPVVYYKDRIKFACLRPSSEDSYELVDVFEANVVDYTGRISQLVSLFEEGMKYYG